MKIFVAFFVCCYQISPHANSHCNVLFCDSQELALLTLGGEKIDPHCAVESILGSFLIITFSVREMKSFGSRCGRRWKLLEEVDVCVAPGRREPTGEKATLRHWVGGRLPSQAMGTVKSPSSAFSQETDTNGLLRASPTSIQIWKQVWPWIFSKLPHQKEFNLGSNLFAARITVKALKVFF